MTQYFSWPNLWKNDLKRPADIVLAAAGLIILSPLIVFLSLLVLWHCGAPVFFRQNRPGLHGAPFRLVKFRSMTNAKNPDGTLKSDAERMTRFGRFLRETSLDELPELWNVLRGDMSLIGPRPLLVEYLPLYTPRQTKRHDVRPGLTGWAQINGRNAISWEKKFELDVWYTENLTFWLDCRILVKTVLAIIRREGISALGEATMPVFKGDESR